MINIPLVHLFIHLGFEEKALLIPVKLRLSVYWDAGLFYPFYGRNANLLFTGSVGVELGLKSLLT